MALHHLRTEVVINAPLDIVWRVLTDFESYPAWNPFIRSISGRPLPGEKLQVRIQPTGAKPMSFSPTVMAAEPGRELRWLGRVLLPGVFDGEHRFLLESTVEGRTHLVHSEQFKGVLVRFLRASLDGQTKAGFEEMNSALKRRAEELWLM
jgi:Uncharacterized conserved protein